jgi:hypothetical protein
MQKVEGSSPFIRFLFKPFPQDMDSGMPRAHAPNEENVSRDIEQVDHQVTVAVLRELAGIRTEVPSNRGFPANKMDELLKRVRVLAQAIVEAPRFREHASVAPSNRKHTT